MSAAIENSSVTRLRPLRSRAEATIPGAATPILRSRHLLGIADLSRDEILALLDLADAYVNRLRGDASDFPSRRLDGRVAINMFFEPSTRTMSSFEIAAKKLGAEVVSMVAETSSLRKGETLLDTVATLNAMRPDVLTIRHGCAGAAALLAPKADCPVINAGDGSHEHPTQALLDALTLRRRKGRLEGLKVAICGDVSHSRVARSNAILLEKVGAEVRFAAPGTLMPPPWEGLNAKTFSRLEDAVDGCDAVMTLRLQFERMTSAHVPSAREYRRFFGLDEDKISRAAPDAIVMHPGPANRGVEISDELADGHRSAIREQVEFGVAARMATLDALMRGVVRSADDTAARAS